MSFTMLGLQFFFHIHLNICWCYDSRFYFVICSSVANQLDVLFLSIFNYDCIILD